MTAFRQDNDAPEIERDRETERTQERTEEAEKEKETASYELEM